MKTLTSALRDHNDNQGSCTSKEISGQPDLWIQTFGEVLKRENAIRLFFETQDIGPQSNVNVILTGAGSSAFIGEITQYAFRKAGFKKTQAIATTDLVTHFQDITDTSAPLLLVSFGRSGNSPESEAVINLADKYCDTVHHLIISCNKRGKIARHTGENTLVFILPPSAEDKGLAMTGSFSSMVLAASLIADINNIETYETKILNIARLGNEILEKYIGTTQEIAKKNFERIIFLGDGPNLGCARESHLKVQELSNGVCIGKFDSFLGFRHGPKVAINDQTLLVYLLSNNPKVLRYQLDLVKQISAQKLGMLTLAIGSSEAAGQYVDINICLNDASKCPEYLLPMPYIIIAQTIGFYKSLFLGLDPDDPSPDGTISRVVEGVKIYDEASDSNTEK